MVSPGLRTCSITQGSHCTISIGIGGTVKALLLGKRLTVHEYQIFCHRHHLEENLTFSFSVPPENDRLDYQCKASNRHIKFSRQAHMVVQRYIKAKEGST